MPLLHALSICTEMRVLPNQPLALAELSAPCSDFTVPQHKPKPKVSPHIFKPLQKMSCIFFLD